MSTPSITDNKTEQTVKISKILLRWLKLNVFYLPPTANRQQNASYTKTQKHNTHACLKRPSGLEGHGCRL